VLTTKQRKEERAAALLVGPFIAGVAFFKLYPMLYGFAISFMDMNSLGKLNTARFVGLRNYARMLGDDTALMSFARSFAFSLVFTAATILLAVLLAILLNRRIFARTAVRTMFYMPYVTNIIAVGIVWKFILNPYSGPVNRGLAQLGVPGPLLPQWLNGHSTALLTTAMISTWMNLAFPVIVILAAIQEVPRELLESAELDGATPLRKALSVTIPQIASALFFVVVVTMITSFRNYAVMMALTDGGPGEATKVISLNIYEVAFTFYKFSYASAQATALFAIILALSVLQRKVQRKWES